MNFFAADGNVVVLCGRHFLHVFPISGPMPSESTTQSIDLHRHLPKGSGAIPEKLSTVCCDISKTGKYIVAADSGKNVFVFEFTGSSWEFFASWEMEKRLVKVQFDNHATFVIMTDKTGDIFLSYMTVKTITAPKRALGHTAVILDVILTQDNSRLISCDRDERIRISQFPSAYQVHAFQLGHKEAIINVALVNSDKHLISISAEGTAILWYMPQNKAVKRWNVFDILKTGRLAHAEVLRMKATDVGGKVYMSVIISGFSNIPIFEIKPFDPSIRLFGQVKLVGDFTDMTWRKDALYTFSPEVPLVKRYHVTQLGMVSDNEFNIPVSLNARKDWREFAMYNKPFYPLKKRVTSEILDTVSHAKSSVLAQFGPLSEQESGPTPYWPAGKSQTIEKLKMSYYQKLIKMSREEKDREIKSDKSSLTDKELAGPSSTQSRPSSSGGGSKRVVFHDDQDAKYKKKEEDGVPLQHFATQTSTSNTVGIGPDAEDPATNTTR